MSDGNIDPYVNHDLELRRVHAGLLALLRDLSSGGKDLAQRAQLVGQALRRHHDVEDTILFPRLRAEAVRRGTDVTFLDECDRGHRSLHDVLLRLATAAEATPVDADAVATLASELAARFSEHTEHEEMALAPARLREMIDLEGLLAIAREAATLRRAVNLRSGPEVEPKTGRRKR